jgi:endonuclease/exonuclease/phosphatase family metal-dependent hydrolase
VLLHGRPREVLVLAVIVATLVGLRLVTHDDDGSSGPGSAAPSTSAPGADPSSTPSSNATLPPQPVAPSSPPLALTEVKCVPSDRHTTLKVVTFNIKSAHFGGRSRLAEIADELRSVDPDVVLLQEVDNYAAVSDGRGDQPALLGSALDYSWSFGLNVRFPRERQYGTAILSRYPIKEQRNVLLPNRPGMQQRGLLGVSVSVHGIPVDIYNTHLQHTSRAMRQDQVNAVVRLLAADPLPKIVGGDFNDTPASPVLQTMYSALSDTWSAVGQGEGHTVPASAPKARIDYLLYGQGASAGTTITPLSSEVLGAGSSDHRAVLATYRIDAEADPVCVPTG